MGYLFDRSICQILTVQEWHLALPHYDFAGRGKTKASISHELSLCFWSENTSPESPKKASIEQ